MERARLQARQAELVQPFADRAFVDFDREAARHLCAQVNAAPAHHLVRHRIRPLHYQRLQLGRLLLVQRSGTTRSRARLQAVDAFVVVAMYPVTQRLPVHAAQLGRFGSRMALQNQHNGQKTTNLCAVTTLGGKYTKHRRRMLRPRDHKGSSHPLSPSVNRQWKKVNQNPDALGTPRVSLMAGWYKTLIGRSGAGRSSSELTVKFLRSLARRGLRGTKLAVLDEPSYAIPLYFQKTKPNVT